MLKLTDYWKMSTKEQTTFKSFHPSNEKTHYQVGGRLNVQTSPTEGFSLQVKMNIWANTEKEAIEKALAEAEHYYGNAYPDYRVKCQFLDNGGPEVKSQ